MNPTQEALQSIVSKLIEKMESTGKWIQPWSNTLPSNFATKRPYNGLNVFILWFIAQERKYPTNSWLSFQQITQLGGKITKGEKATDVFFFKPLTVKETDENGEETEKTVPLLKSFKVFNISQTDLKIETNELETIPSVEEFVNNINIEIIEDSMAYYLPNRHVIAIPNKNKFTSIEAYYSTLLHELAHSTGKELERDLTGKFGSPSYQTEELIAETTKTFLASYLQIEHEDSSEFKNSASYLKSWLKGSNAKDLFKIFSQAQKAFDLLVSYQQPSAIAA